MGGASRPKAVTMLGKRRVPLLLENLQQGLLDQSVDDARYAELSDPAVRLGDFDPLDRLRLVDSIEQLGPNAWPVLTQVVLSVVDGHPIHARTALIPSNAFPRSYEIGSVAHLLHQLFRHSRAFGCWFRHECFWSLMDMDFVISRPLVRPEMPLIRFLFVRSRFCSALPSDATSR